MEESVSLVTPGADETQQPPKQKPRGFMAVVVLIHMAYVALVPVIVAICFWGLQGDVEKLRTTYWIGAGLFALLAVLLVIRCYHRPGTSRRWAVIMCIASAILMAVLTQLLPPASSNNPSDSTGGLWCSDGYFSGANPVPPHDAVYEWREFSAPLAAGPNEDPGPGFGPCDPLG